MGIGMERTGKIITSAALILVLVAAGLATGDILIIKALGVGTANVPTGVMMAVDGKLLCEEVEVQLSQDWPDYVFDEDYELIPLEELERSVRQHKHLPGIPSAAEVKSQGINVGEMQADVIKKVEELTLYVIDLNKQLKVVKRENRAILSLLGMPAGRIEAEASR
ncbi:MAG: hypothetical protein IH987_02685 [Planctomycetes bacterium]|nr:hypothetical protein [Planctomycetota bacterium]